MRAAEKLAKATEGLLCAELEEARLATALWSCRRSFCSSVDDWGFRQWFEDWHLRIFSLQVAAKLADAVRALGKAPGRAAAAQALNAARKQIAKALAKGSGGSVQQRGGAAGAAASGGGGGSGTTD